MNFLSRYFFCLNPLSCDQGHTPVDELIFDHYNFQTGPSKSMNLKTSGRSTSNSNYESGPGSGYNMPSTSKTNPNNRAESQRLSPSRGDDSGPIDDPVESGEYDIDDEKFDRAEKLYEDELRKWELNQSQTQSLAPMSTKPSHKPKVKPSLGFRYVDPRKTHEHKEISRGPILNSTYCDIDGNRLDNDSKFGKVFHGHVVPEIPITIIGDFNSSGDSRSVSGASTNSGKDSSDDVYSTAEDSSDASLHVNPSRGSRSGTTSTTVAEGSVSLPLSLPLPSHTVPPYDDMYSVAVFGPGPGDYPDKLNSKISPGSEYAKTGVVKINRNSKLVTVQNKNQNGLMKTTNAIVYPNGNTTETKRIDDIEAMLIDRITKKHENAKQKVLLEVLKRAKSLDEEKLKIIINNNFSMYFLEIDEFASDIRERSSNLDHNLYYLSAKIPDSEGIEGKKAQVLKIRTQLIANSQVLNEWDIEEIIMKTLRIKLMTKIEAKNYADALRRNLSHSLMPNTDLIFKLQEKIDTKKDMEIERIKNKLSDLTIKSMTMSLKSGTLTSRNLIGEISQTDLIDLMWTSMRMLTKSDAKRIVATMFNKPINRGFIAVSPGENLVLEELAEWDQTSEIYKEHDRIFKDSESESVTSGNVSNEVTVSKENGHLMWKNIMKKRWRVRNGIDTIVIERSADDLNHSMNHNVNDYNLEHISLDTWSRAEKIYNNDCKRHSLDTNSMYKENLKEIAKKSKEIKIIDDDIEIVEKEIYLNKTLSIPNSYYFTFFEAGIRNWINEREELIKEKIKLENELNELKGSHSHSASDNYTNYINSSLSLNAEKTFIRRENFAIFMQNRNWRRELERCLPPSRRTSSHDNPIETILKQEEAELHTKKQHILQLEVLRHEQHKLKSLGSTQAQLKRQGSILHDIRDPERAFRNAVKQYNKEIQNDLVELYDAKMHQIQMKGHVNKTSRAVAKPTSKQIFVAPDGISKGKKTSNKVKFYIAKQKLTNQNQISSRNVNESRSDDEYNTSVIQDQIQNMVIINDKASRSNTGPAVFYGIKEVDKNPINNIISKKQPFVITDHKTLTVDSHSDSDSNVVHDIKIGDRYFVYWIAKMDGENNYYRIHRHWLYNLDVTEDGNTELEFN